MRNIVVIRGNLIKKITIDQGCNAHGESHVTIV
jgi:hypothetical protein